MCSACCESIRVFLSCSQAGLSVLDLVPVVPRVVDAVLAVDDAPRMVHGPLADPACTCSCCTKHLTDLTCTRKHLAGHPELGSAPHTRVQRRAPPTSAQLARAHPGFWRNQGIMVSSSSVGSRAHGALTPGPTPRFERRRRPRTIIYMSARSEATSAPARCVQCSFGKPTPAGRSKRV